MHSPRHENEGGHHGGGDMGLIRSFVEAVKARDKNVLGEDTGVDDAVLAHLVVFAAEKSRREGIVVDVNEFERELKRNMAL